MFWVLSLFYTLYTPSIVMKREFYLFPQSKEMNLLYQRRTMIEPPSSMILFQSRPKYFVDVLQIFFRCVYFVWRLKEHTYSWLVSSSTTLLIHKLIQRRTFLQSCGEMKLLSEILLWVEVSEEFNGKNLSLTVSIQV